MSDWLEHTTKFVYAADSNLKNTMFPAGTSNEDAYAYDEADAMSGVKMTKGAEVLASLAYLHSKRWRHQSHDQTAPRRRTPAYTYDTNSRLTKGAGVGGEVLAGRFADAELSAYAKLYSALLSAVAYGTPFAEDAAAASAAQYIRCTP